MFVLSELQMLIRLCPEGFDKPIEEQIKDELNLKLSNKILINVGLCISLFDILEIGESHLFPGDGAAHTKVRFRMLVFRPRQEEILVGKIKACSREGVTVSLGFFDDILIPSESLQHPSRFDGRESVWVWEYPVEDGHHDLFMDPGEQIRFRVILETFVDSGPVKAEPRGGGSGDAGQEESCPTPKVAPYSLTATLNEPGLGLLSWWS